MFLQTVMTNRRKFLERSLLGAGGLLFSSALLESCITDHVIPSPIANPPLLGDAIDWNDDARIVVTAGLGMIPEVGEILSVLAEIFWPNTTEDVWGEVKEQVEALLNQRISDLVYQQVSEDLQGLNNTTLIYLNELRNGTPGEKLTQWIITRNLFAQALPHFQSKGYELLLLPLFTQFANMYLSVLRDGVAFGKDWGRNNADQQQDITDLKKAVTDFTTYATTTYNTGRANLLNSTPANNHLCEPFRTVNRFDRQMTFTVLDFVNTWAYYDVTLYPTGKKVVLTREVYSDPYGTCDNSGNIVITTPVPTKPPTQITVWAWDRVDAVQVTYPAGTGPGGVTQTPKMGGGGGSNQQFGGTAINSLTNPITAFRVYSGDILNVIQFRYDDGTLTQEYGGRYPGGNDSGAVGYAYEILSSVHINGISYAYQGSADCVVCGFQFWADRPSVASAAVRAIYVKSPKERSTADFANAFPSVSIPAGLITDELKAARAAYWASVTARAKALK